MRAVFTVDIPVDREGHFSADKEVLDLVRSFGWEPIEVRKYGDDEAAKQIRYKEMADELFTQMPEIANEEKDNAIFFGYIADDQTKFVITRRVEGQITFRLLHPNLPRLQSSTEKAVKKILNAPFVGTKSLRVSNQSVVIYERGFEHIILSGRVIPSPFRETFRSDRKDLILFIFPLIIDVPLMLTLPFVDATAHRLISGTLERSSTALLTTSLVSALGLLQTYLEINRNHIIAWNFTNDSRAK
jgi:hypothetical protein